MSEEKFSVPVKTPMEKEKLSATKKSSTTKAQPKTTSVKKNAQNAKAKSGQEVKPKTSSSKSSTVSKRKPNPALDSIPDMSLLSATERHNLILGKTNETKKSEKKEVKSPERSVKLDTIKKVQSERKAIEEIPKLGARKKVKTIPIIPMIWVLIIICLVLFMSLALVYHKRGKSEVVPPISVALTTSEEVVLNIEQGMSAFQVATQLSPILDETAFLNELTTRGLEGAIQVGKYKISKGASVDEIISAIIRKSENYIKIYDGQDIASIDKLLANKGLSKDGEFVKACKALQKEYDLPFVEGWLLSGSYAEPKKDVATVLAHEMHSALLSFIKAHSEAFNASEYSISELLIIASMIQRETQDESQMPLIASVIFNRLKADMPLGIDATSRYELGDWKNEIPQSTYDKLTPYNTRRQKGLPPTGIGCVSEKALLAVLSPAETDYLYYRHGTDGALYLSRTYNEHLQAAPVAQKN